MSRHFTPMDKAIHSNTIGDIQAICAENQLLSPAFFCSECRLEPPKEMDTGGALKAITQEGDHIYTEDNMVIFHEWTKDKADNMSGSLFAHLSNFDFVFRVATGTHPGTLKAGDLINMGVSFRIVHYSGKGCIQVRLDPVAVMDRQCCIHYCWRRSRTCPRWSSTKETPFGVTNCTSCQRTEHSR